MRRYSEKPSMKARKAAMTMNSEVRENSWKEEALNTSSEVPMCTPGGVLMIFIVHVPLEVYCRILVPSIKTARGRRVSIMAGCRWNIVSTGLERPVCVCVCVWVREIMVLCGTTSLWHWGYLIPPFVVPVDLYSTSNLTTLRL